MLFSPRRQMTFASFESRPGSVHARSAGARFASRQGIAYSEPILILAGRPGAGKTHLLHATANLAKSNAYIHASSTLGACRLAEEVELATEYGDLHCLTRRFAEEDFLAIDDVDDLFCRPQACDFLLHVLQLRSAARRRTLLSASLTKAQDMRCELNHFLNHQTAIRLL